MIALSRRAFCIIFQVIFVNTSVAWVNTCGRLLSGPHSQQDVLNAAVFQHRERNDKTVSRTILHWVDDQVVNDPSSPNDNDDEVFDDDYLSTLVPSPDLSPEEIPDLLMRVLQKNDFPEVDSGLRIMWEFAGGNTKHIFKHNITEYIESAHETADTLPTSFYGVAMNGMEWTFETKINRVGGEEGWIATKLMKTISSDGRMRRWQWELRKNKRPPCLGCWIVEAIASSDRKGKFEVE